LLSVQRLCKRLLETQGGLDVTTADDGDVALQRLIDSYAPGGTPVDFVLMDLQACRCSFLLACDSPPWSLRCGASVLHADARAAAADAAT
jgi:hypothetical protein